MSLLHPKAFAGPVVLGTVEANTQHSRSNVACLWVEVEPRRTSCARRLERAGTVEVPVPKTLPLDALVLAAWHNLSITFM